LNYGEIFYNINFISYYFNSKINFGV